VLSSDNEEMLSRFIDGFNDDNFLLIMEAVVELETVENPPCGLFKVLLRRMTCSETWMQQKGNATVVLSVRMVSIILKNCLKTFESNVLEFIRSDNFKRFTAAMEHLMKSNNSLDRAAAVSAALTLMMYYYPITPGLIDRKRLATMIIDAAEFSVVYEEDQSVQATISRQMNNRFGTTGDGERMNYLRCRHLLLNIF
jgi:hypothetical protein